MQGATVVSETTIQISDYQELANSTDIKKGSPSLDFPLLGLLGEIGGLSSALKKHQREGEKFTNYKEIIQEELGDCLWYLSSTKSWKEKSNRCPSLRII